MNQNLTIRNAKAEEIDLLVDFQIKMALETEILELDQDTVKKGVSAVFNDPSKGRYLVVEWAGEVIASLLTTYEWSDWRNQNVLYIQSLYVVPKARAKGVFKQMYQYLQEEVNKGYYAGIRLYVDKRNQGAVQVYQKIGMDGEHYHFYEWFPQN